VPALGFFGHQAAAMCRVKRCIISPGRERPLHEHIFKRGNRQSCRSQEDDTRWLQFRTVIIPISTYDS